MYNLTVDVARTYYVSEGQWLVHNCGDFLAREYKFSGSLAQHIRDLERGFPNKPEGARLPDDYQLTDDQRAALATVTQKIIQNTIPGVEGGASTVQSLVNQVSNPRFRFIDQVPEARDALMKALESFPEARSVLQSQLKK